MHVSDGCEREKKLIQDNSITIRLIIDTAVNENDAFAVAEENSRNVEEMQREEREEERNRKTQRGGKTLGELGWAAVLGRRDPARDFDNKGSCQRGLVFSRAATLDNECRIELETFTV